MSTNVYPQKGGE